MFNQKLPLWHRVIFVDWHGVLSVDQFWLSVLSNKSHPLYADLRREVERLFSDRELVERWMRGEMASADVIAQIDIQLDKRFRHDYLERRLYRDCLNMVVNERLLELLRDAACHAFLVLATDNMDCFEVQWRAVSSRTRASGPARQSTLKHVATEFDDVICSSRIGSLKREAYGFFGSWLEHNQLSFQQALLLDDRADNCAAFVNAGGAAVRVLPSDLENGFTRVRPAVLSWLAR